ncbi:MAG: hypothetical protein C0501_13255 [Isosphaera sp.]|nr:hypothetical protein [Isosphaera sp.]
MPAGMKRVVVLAALGCLAGCSNAPVAGFLDAVAPSRPVGPRPPDRPRPDAPGGDRIPPRPDLLPPVGPPAPGGN